MLPFGYQITISRLKKTVDVNELHPELKAPIEKAFKIKDIQYWTFKNTMDMPAKRYSKMNEFIREAEMRMTSEELIHYLDITDKAINKGDITLVVKMLGAIRICTEQFIETDTFYRLFSNVFFTIDEDLTDYDYDFNEAKIELFKSEPIEDFFFKKPVKEYLPQIDISKEDLKTFSKQTKVKNAYVERVKSEILKRLEETG